ncbi:MAG: hypothetical protein ACE5D1_07370, partial [Fidelibacterota bacterium]
MRRPPVKPQSIRIFSDGIFIQPDSVEPVSGTVFIRSSRKDTERLIISYETLDNIFPKHVGPLAQELPEWNGDSQPGIPPSTAGESPRGKPSDSGESLLSSGTVFRNFELSPTGGNEFTGGLQLQLQGKLTPDITVSGILSDQNFPIQPEGN